MRRAIVFAVMVALVPLAAPAEAHSDACAFHGTMALSGPSFPLVTATPGPPTTWTMYIVVGLCAASSSFWATGDISGSLYGTTTGTGVTDMGHRFAFTGGGGTVYLGGQVVGGLSLAWLATSGLSVEGAIALVD